MGEVFIFLKIKVSQGDVRSLHSVCHNTSLYGETEHFKVSHPLGYIHIIMFTLISFFFPHLVMLVFVVYIACIIPHSLLWA